MGEGCLRKAGKRTCSAYSVGYTDTYFITREKFVKVAQTFPKEFKEVLKKVDEVLNEKKIANSMKKMNLSTMELGVSTMGLGDTTETSNEAVIEEEVGRDSDESNKERDVDDKGEKELKVDEEANGQKEFVGVRGRNTIMSIFKRGGSTVSSILRRDFRALGPRGSGLGILNFSRRFSLSQTTERYFFLLYCPFQEPIGCHYFSAFVLILISLLKLFL